MTESTDYLASWGFVLIGGVMLLHAAHALGTRSINFEGDWIEESHRPSAFRLALWAEAGLAVFLVVAGLLSL